VILQRDKQTNKQRQQRDLSGGDYETDLELVWLRCVGNNDVVSFSQLHLYIISHHMEKTEAGLKSLCIRKIMIK